MIKVKSIKTEYGNWTVGRSLIINNRYKELEKKFSEWRKHPIGSFVVSENDYDVVDEIQFYPKKNKFIILSKGKIISAITTREYSVTVQ